MPRTADMRASYRSRVLALLHGQARPLTFNKISEGVRPRIGWANLQAVLDEMVGDGTLEEGEAVQAGRTFATYRIARPVNRIAGLVATNGQAHGRALAPVLEAISATETLDRISRHVESLRALADWPSLPIGEILDRHCHATGKDRQALILREILPLLIEAES